MKYTFTFNVTMRGSYTTTVDADDKDTALDLATDNYNCADWENFEIDGFDPRYSDYDVELINEVR